MKRFMLRLLPLCLLILLLPAAVLSAAAEEEEQYGTVTAWDINPIYSDVFSFDAADTPPVFFGALGSSRNVYSSIEEAGAALRQGMADRETTVIIRFTRPAGTERTTESMTSWFRQILSIAKSHTGVPYEGDYIVCNYGGCTVSMSYSGSTEAGWSLTYTYTVTYYTDASQEAAVDAQVPALLSSLGVSDMTGDYEKIAAIYGWIVRNVSYDNTNLKNDSYTLKYSAYAALINRTAVCQGYSALFYRLALTAGVSARCISSISRECHMWNVAAVDGVWYDLDATWDSNRRVSYTKQSLTYPGTYYWFLQCDASFTSTGEHTRGDDGAAICAALALASYDYVTATGNCGESLNWALLHSGELLITGTGDMWDYTAGVCAPWGSYLPQITSLTVGSGVTGIGAYAFQTCTALTSVSLPDTLTVVGGRAFYGTGLTAVTYAGSASQWAAVEVDSGNELLLNAELTLQACDEIHNYTGGFADGVCSRCGQHVDLTVLTVLYLPDSLTALGSEALSGTAAQVLIIPAACTSVETDALSDCADLLYVFLPSAMEGTFAAADLLAASSGLQIIYYAE